MYDTKCFSTAKPIVRIMSFRKIRPSFGDSSASTSNPSQPTSESTGSDPRRVRAEKEAAETSNSSLSSKRRRVPESVTRNACLNCKKARAKVGCLLPTACCSRVRFIHRGTPMRLDHSFQLTVCSVMGKSHARDVLHE